jgi:hypothetical protein
MGAPYFNLRFFYQFYNSEVQCALRKVHSEQITLKAASKLGHYTLLRNFYAYSTEPIPTLPPFGPTEGHE